MLFLLSLPSWSKKSSLLNSNPFGATNVLTLGLSSK
nr:MAG TPA: hypothetical protein [Crassvirales sp.]